MKDGKYWVGKFKKSFKVKPGGLIHFDKVRGDIMINSWEKDEVLIHETKQMDIFSKEEAKTALRLSESACIQKDNTITIGGEPFNRKWIQSTFEVLLPKKFNCTLETQGGDLSISNINGQIEASTGGGDISVENIDGTVEVKTGGGDVVICKTTHDVVIKTGGGDINIETINGRVQIASGGGDITGSHIKSPLTIETGGGDIDIQELIGELTIKTGGGDIDIINVTGNVSVQTGGGDLNMELIQGDFIVTTGGGDIDGEEIKGNVNIQTGGGDIELLKIVGSVEAKSGGGDINLEDIHGNTQVMTGGGDIDLIKISGGIEAQSGDGDVTAELILDSFTKDQHVTIETGEGDIDLTIPGILPATIKAIINADRYDSDDYHINSDFPLTISRTKSDGKHHFIQATGDINGGGIEILLKTNGGDIDIQKH